MIEIPTRDGTIPRWPIPILDTFLFISYNFIYCITVSEKFINPWTHGMQYNVRFKQPFYIIQHSNIKSKVLCSVWVSLRLIINTRGCKVSKSTQYHIFWRYQYFEIDRIPDTLSTLYRFRPISNFHLLTSITCMYFGNGLSW